MRIKEIIRCRAFLLLLLILPGLLNLNLASFEVHAAENASVLAETDSYGYADTSRTAEQEIFEHILNTSGFNAAVACGILANMYRESRFASNNLQGTYAKRFGHTDASYTKAVDNGTYRYKSYKNAKDSFAHDSAGYGLCQWTTASRKLGLYNAAKKAGASISDIKVQIDYMFTEMSSSLKAKLKACPDDALGAYQAGYYWCYLFERPAHASSASVKRGNLARDTYWPKYKEYKNFKPVREKGSYRTTASITVRSGANPSASRLGTISKNTTVKVTEVKSYWGKISYKGETGWISLTNVKYVEHVFYVKFDPEGGEGEMSVMTASYGLKNYLDPNRFTKEGYHFIGWNAYRESDGKWYTTEDWKTEEEIEAEGYELFLYKDGNNVSKTSKIHEDTIVMHAVWEKYKSFTLDFDANGGCGEMKPQVIEFGVDTKIAMSSFTKKGYHVSGWNAHRETDDKWYTKDGWKTSEEIEKNGYELFVYGSNSKVAKTCPVDGGHVTMFAVWKINTYNLKFDKNAKKVSGSMSNQKITYGEDTPIKANSFKKAGYTFVGWHAYRTSDKKWYTDHEWQTASEISKHGYKKRTYPDQKPVAKTSSVHNDTVIMYAQWKKK